MYRDAEHFSALHIVDDWHRALELVHDPERAVTRVWEITRILLRFGAPNTAYTIRHAVLDAMLYVTDEINDLHGV